MVRRLRCDGDDDLAVPRVPPPVRQGTQLTERLDAETFATTAAGAVLGALAGRLVSRSLVGPAAIVGALNGALAGRRRIHDWASWRGRAAFVLDSTWALGTTAAALGSHLIAAALGDPGYVADLSERQNRHVYRRGFRPRRNFVITVGNVVSGAGDTDAARRRDLVAIHEDVHVWQARALGPFYPLAYAAWTIGGGIIGAGLWAVRHRDRPPTAVIETCAYYLNPFEWWAYSRDGSWPPAGAVADLAWSAPLVSARASRGSRAERR